MEEILYYTKKPATLKLEIRGNRFLLNTQAQINTGLKNEERVMFGFNYKENKAYIFKDDELDAFLLKTKGKNDKSLRFTSKHLASHFFKCFGINENQQSYFFNVARKANNKGAYLLTLKN